MIHVEAQPEPANFDAAVRQRGLAYLKKRGISLYEPLPPKTKIYPYWRDCLDDLFQSYQSICAYLAIFIYPVTGSGSVEHFIAKSKRVDLAYEWHNYRLVCLKMNSRKREYEDVLDPFEIEDGWFHLELVSGHIYPNPSLPDERKTKVKATINRLGLDDPGNREMRARFYLEYCEGHCDEAFLKKYYPIIWFEAQRQNLL